MDDVRGTIEKPPLLTPMLLWCPQCNQRHIDVGEYETKPHHTHACQHCGMVWRPALIYTRGVRFLPGFKNDPFERLVNAQKEKDGF